jgi:hypothetical protein
MDECRLSLADKGLRRHWGRVKADVAELRCSFTTVIDAKKQRGKSIKK